MVVGSAHGVGCFFVIAFGYFILACEVLDLLLRCAPRELAHLFAHGAVRYYRLAMVSLCSHTDAVGILAQCGFVADVAFLCVA